jgi:hypothetical protein
MAMDMASASGVESDGDRCQYALTDVISYGTCQGGYCFAFE